MIREAWGDVLEVAAGTGRNLSLYPPALQSLTLVDVSDKMLDEARKKTPSIDKEVKLNL